MRVRARLAGMGVTVRGRVRVITRARVGPRTACVSVSPAGPAHAALTVSTLVK